MADHYIILIPNNPAHVPDPAQQLAAEAFLREIAPEADHVRSATSDTVRFIDCGQNFEHIACPFCGERLDASGWWSQTMVSQYHHERGFRLEPITLPCCNERTTLHNLDYHWAQGFGRYTLEAMNPNIGALSEEILHQITTLLSCDLRVIYRRL
ncbi:MAG: hypothetical protein K8S97_15610, partial [Anaerolineae bacterium]|nr:hypothetical protein [Anaerolineae bacterium]